MITSGDFLKEYQSVLVQAYERLRAGDKAGYSAAVARAASITSSARRELSRRELDLYVRFARRSAEVVRKCNSLGLRHLDRRLAEFRLVEALESLVTQRRRKRPKLSTGMQAGVAQGSFAFVS